MSLPTCGAAHVEREGWQMGSLARAVGCDERKQLLKAESLVFLNLDFAKRTTFEKG